MTPVADATILLRRLARTPAKPGILGSDGATISGSGARVREALTTLDAGGGAAIRYFGTAPWYPRARPAVASPIPDRVSASQLLLNLQAVRHPIPGDPWPDLKTDGLVRGDPATPAGEMVHAS